VLKTYLPTTAKSRPSLKNYTSRPATGISWVLDRDLWIRWHQQDWFLCQKSSDLVFFTILHIDRGLVIPEPDPINPTKMRTDRIRIWIRNTNWLTLDVSLSSRTLSILAFSLSSNFFTSSALAEYKIIFSRIIRVNFGQTIASTRYRIKLFITLLNYYYK